jgi:hypothetical protein
MGSFKFKSRISTNSFSGMNNTAYSPFYFQAAGNSFNNLSKAQYSHQIYYQSATIGAGSGGRAERWLRANVGQPISFVP